MMPLLRFAALAVSVVLPIVACGSSSSKNVGEASCSSSGATFTDADCQRLGSASGCESSSVSGAGCSFKNCDSPPSCAPTASAADAGSADAAVSPRCAETTNGLWSTTPPCSDVSTTTVNGTPRYACKCSGSIACPCNFKCGSISLPTGGVISSVCAP
jgi:hypothetical protein